MKAVGIAGLAIVLAAGVAHAGDISAKKMMFKSNADPAKKQFQVQSSDAGVTYSDADNPLANGASIHIYSATDDLCYVIPEGTDWTDKTGKSWKYKNKTTKNQIQIQDGKLQLKLRSGVALDLSNPEVRYNVLVQIGDTGEQFCMNCAGAEVTTDDAKKFQGKDCNASPCDAEPSVCNPNVTTTTTTSTTTTTMPALPGTILKAVLTQSIGNFNYGAGGLVGANDVCNTTFAGTHACSITELQSAQAAGDLDHIKDVDDDVVTSFWAIDSLRPHSGQCGATTMAGPDWTYGTGHLGVGGDFVALDNASGVLAAVTLGGDGNPGGRNCNATQRWVGCCQ